MPGDGLGRKWALMQAWLDAMCGAAGWTAERDAEQALAIHFVRAADAGAFVARFCCGFKIPPAAFERRGQAGASL